MRIRCGLIWLACMGTSGHTVVVSSRRFTQVSTAHFFAKFDSLMGVSKIIWCPVIGTALYLKIDPFVLCGEIVAEVNDPTQPCTHGYSGSAR